MHDLVFLHLEDGATTLLCRHLKSIEIIGVLKPRQADSIVINRREYCGNLASFVEQAVTISDKGGPDLESVTQLAIVLATGYARPVLESSGRNIGSLQFEKTMQLRTDTHALLKFCCEHKLDSTESWTGRVVFEMHSALTCRMRPLYNSQSLPER